MLMKKHSFYLYYCLVSFIWLTLKTTILVVKQIIRYNLKILM